MSVKKKKVVRPKRAKSRSDKIGAEEMAAREDKFLLKTYKRSPFHPVKGKGAVLTDVNGRKYWDLFSGIAVNSLGYGHPAIVRVLREAAKDGILHVSNLYYQPWQGLLAEKLVLLSGLKKVFFGNSGTEANEGALKFARLKNPGREKVIALDGSFHGRTLGALSVTGSEKYRGPFKPLIPGAVFIKPNDMEALRREATADTLAMILEPVLGEGGVIPLENAFLAEARKLADKTGAVLIFDEVQTALGRTGTMFAFQQSGVMPDIMTMAKPIGGGLPLGAILVGPSIEGLVAPGHHASTFGGNPLACRLGIAVVDEIFRKGLVKKVSETGKWFGSELAGLASRSSSIAEIRGRGLMWGIELKVDAAPVAAKLLEKGFIVGTARNNVIRIVPPFIIPRSALTGFIKTFEKILKETENAK